MCGDTRFLQPGVPTFSTSVPEAWSPSMSMSYGSMSMSLHPSRAGVLPAPVGADGGMPLRGGESHQAHSSRRKLNQARESWSDGRVGGWMGKATSRWEGEWRPTVVH